MTAAYSLAGFYHAPCFLGGGSWYLYCRANAAFDVRYLPAVGTMGTRSERSA
jgi:hypothetical protein